MIDKFLTLPEYLRSTDFKVFEGLSKIMFGAIKKDIDGIPNLKDYANCQEHMLPILADYIGCPYFSETTPYVNRLIIKNWWWLMKNRGTMPSIEMASSLGMLAYNKVQSVSEIDIYGRTVEIVFDKTTGTIYIRVVYQSVSQEDSILKNEEQLEWIKKIVEYVRPCGFKVVYSPAEFMKAFLDMNSSHDIQVIAFNYFVTAQSGVGLTLLSDTSYTFKDVYDIISGNSTKISPTPESILNEHGIPICPNGLVFGEYKSNSVYHIQGDTSDYTCGEDCPYKSACQAFTILGLGQQELTAVSTYGSSIHRDENDE